MIDFVFGGLSLWERHICRKLSSLIPQRLVVFDDFDSVWSWVITSTRHASSCRHSKQSSPSAWTRSPSEIQPTLLSPNKSIASPDDSSEIKNIGKKTLKKQKIVSPVKIQGFRAYILMSMFGKSRNFRYWRVFSFFSLEHKTQTLQEPMDQMGWEGWEHGTNLWERIPRFPAVGTNNWGNMVLALNNIHPSYPSSIFTVYQVPNSHKYNFNWFDIALIMYKNTCLSHKHDCITRIPTSLHDKRWYKMIQTWYTYDRHIIYWSHLFINKKYKKYYLATGQNPMPRSTGNRGFAPRKNGACPDFVSRNQLRFPNGNGTTEMTPVEVSKSWTRTRMKIHVPTERVEISMNNKLAKQCWY